MRPPAQTPTALDVVAAGDLRRRLHCLLEGIDVGGEAPLSLHGRGIAPAHREGLETLRHRVLDEAAPRGQVHHVVLVDLRRDHDHRPVSDHGGGRRVLEELADLVAVDDGTRRHGQVPTHLVGPRGDRPGHAPVVQHIPSDIADAPPDASSGRFPRPLQRFGVEREVVRRSQGRGEEANGEAGPLARCASRGRHRRPARGGCPSRPDRTGPTGGRPGAPAMLGSRSASPRGSGDTSERPRAIRPHSSVSSPSRRGAVVVATRRPTWATAPSRPRASKEPSSSPPPTTASTSSGATASAMAASIGDAVPVRARLEPSFPSGSMGNVHDVGVLEAEPTAGSREGAVPA